MIAAAKGTNQNASGGFFVEGGQEYLIRGVGRVSAIGGHRQHRGRGSATGVPVTVGELAEVRIGRRDQARRRSGQGKPAVILAVQKQPDANTLKLTAAGPSSGRDPADPAGGYEDRPANLPAVGLHLGGRPQRLGALRDGAILVVVILLLFPGESAGHIHLAGGHPALAGGGGADAQVFRRHHQHDDPRRHGHRHRRAGGRRHHRRGERLPPAAREHHRPRGSGSRPEQCHLRGVAWRSAPRSSSPR